MLHHLFIYLTSLIKGFNRKEEGQTLSEYALIIALVALALIVALGLLTGGIQGVFNRIVAAFGNV